MYNISLENKLTAIFKRGSSWTPFVLYINNNTISPVFYTCGEAARWLVENKYSYNIRDRKLRSFSSAVVSRFTGFVKKKSAIKNTLTYQFFKNNDTRAYVIALDTDEEQQLFMDDIEYKWYKNFMERLESGVYHN